MTDDYTPSPDDHFTFGLWTVGNRGAIRSATRCGPRSIPSTRSTGSPSSAPTASTSTTTTSCRRVVATEREAILKRFRRALDETGLRVPMATTNLFSGPVFKEGAFTANDPAVRRFAIAKTLDAIELGVELGRRST